jgi:transposase
VCDTGVVPTRFIGLDVHKHYLVACGVDAEQNQILGPQRVMLSDLDRWVSRTLSADDALVLEMTTNTWQLYDELAPYVHSVTVVHPPHVGLVTKVQVKTDRQAALALAQLHAAGILKPVWVPPPEVRDQRAILAQRAKMVRLSTQAKNRLHSVLHRHHLSPPKGKLFAPEGREGWLALPLSFLERARVECDLDTLAFARSQITRLEATLSALAAEQNDRLVPLLQLPGLAMISGLTLLAAIGDVARFPTAKHLVGYAGLGARVHDSGQTHHTGRITKTGRRDIRAVMVEAAHTASRVHPHWRAELARLEPRLGHNKAIVAIARKLLVVAWHALSDGVADHLAESEQVARKFVEHAYRLGAAGRPAGVTCGQYVRQQLDRLGLGAELTAIRWGSRTIVLPPSQQPMPAS